MHRSASYKSNTFFAHRRGSSHGIPAQKLVRRAAKRKTLFIMLRMRKNWRSHRRVAMAASAGASFDCCRCQSRRLPRRQSVVRISSPRPE